MRIPRTTIALGLAVALVPAVALAGGDRDRDRSPGFVPPVATLPAPGAAAAQTFYLVKGTVSGAPTATGFTMSVTKANAAAATALGGATAQAGPLNPPVSLAVMTDANTRVLRVERRERKHSHHRSRGTVSTQLSALQVGDDVMVKWTGAAGLTAATLATTPARTVFAAGLPAATPPAAPVVKYKIKGTVATLPVSGAPTLWIDPAKMNTNAAKALNPANPAITGGQYDLPGLVPVTIDATTRVKVKGRHHGSHSRGKWSGTWALRKVAVGDRIEVEWKVPASATFYTSPAKKVEIKRAKRR